MGKYISFGKYNKLYKYIWIYVIIRIVNDYLFSGVFPDKIKPSIFESHNYPPINLVQSFFIYLGTFIFAILLFHYLKSKVKNKDKITANQNEPNKKYEFIYYIYLPDINIKTIILTIIFSIISIELIQVLNVAGFEGLLYWVFDLFIIAYINLKMFDIPLYSHKKFAIIFIIIICTLFKILSTYEYISNDNFKLFYKNHIILIPIIIIIYLFISVLRFYSICKIKWLLDFKYIHTRRFFPIYNFF